jgi:hypothetical protein
MMPSQGHRSRLLGGPRLSGGGGHAEAHLNLAALDCFDLPRGSLNSVPTYMSSAECISLGYLYVSPYVGTFVH